jgi:hypothetical protein
MSKIFEKRSKLEGDYEPIPSIQNIPMCTLRVFTQAFLNISNMEPRLLIMRLINHRFLWLINKILSSKINPLTIQIIIKSKKIPFYKFTNKFVKKFALGKKIKGS